MVINWVRFSLDDLGAALWGVISELPEPFMINGKLLFDCFFLWASGTLLDNREGFLLDWLILRFFFVSSWPLTSSFSFLPSFSSMDSCLSSPSSDFELSTDASSWATSSSSSISSSTSSSSSSLASAPFSSCPSACSALRLAFRNN